MIRPIAFLIPAFLVAATVPALGAPVVEDNAVVNGEFELAASQARPAACLLFGEGYVNVFEPTNPYGLPWLAGISPCHQGAVTAAQWSHGAGALFEDFDGDGDREGKILPGIVDPQVGNHNMWQAYSNAQQAFTAGFDTISFRVESGTAPAGSMIYLGLSETPLSGPTPWVVLFIDCLLVLPLSAFTAEIGDDGVTYSASPSDGNLLAAAATCNNEVAAWNQGDAEERIEVASKLRIVQTSLANFNSGIAPVVVDGVQILGAPTAVEAAAGL